MNGSFGSYVIYAGTNDCVEISLDHPWLANSPWIEDNPSFWLRAPYEEFDDYALQVYCGPQGYGVYTDHVENEAPVLPAFCLNLESFLFASPIDSDSSGAKWSDGGMILRFQASDTQISGSLSYNDDAACVIDGGETTLYVKGKDGTGDWKYAKQNVGTETITKEMIGHSLKGAKVWLEKNVDGVRFVKMGTPGAKI